MRRLISFLAIIMILTACSPATAMPTATVEVPPSATSTSTPAATDTPTTTATKTAVPTETFAPFNLDSKTCTPDDAPGILAAVQEKFHFSPDTPDGRLITNVETSPTYEGPMEVAFKCKLTGIMKDPSGRQGDVSVDGLTLVVFHIKVAGQDAFLQLIYDDYAIKNVLSGSKLKTGRPGILNASPGPDDLRLKPRVWNVEYLEDYNSLGGKLAQLKAGSPIPKSIQSQPFVGVFFNP